MSDTENQFELSDRNFKFVIFYLAIYRLIIVIAGMLCIYMGYLLLLSGVFPNSVKGSSLSGAIGDTKLTLDNAAPGTIFALFGAVVIIAMIVKSPPEFRYKSSDGDDMTVRSAPPMED